MIVGIERNHNMDLRLDEIKQKVGLAHDCCLYARSYFETRQKPNNPDNELGKTLKAIKLLDEAYSHLNELIESVDEVENE